MYTYVGNQPDVFVDPSGNIAACPSSTVVGNLNYSFPSKTLGPYHLQWWLAADLTVSSSVRLQVEACCKMCSDGTKGYDIKATGSVRGNVEAALYIGLRDKGSLGGIGYDLWVGGRIYGGIEFASEGGIELNTCTGKMKGLFGGSVTGYVGGELGGQVKFRGWFGDVETLGLVGGVRGGIVGSATVKIHDNDLWWQAKAKWQGRVYGRIRIWRFSAQAQWETTADIADSGERPFGIPQSIDALERELVKFVAHGTGRGP